MKSFTIDVRDLAATFQVEVPDHLDLEHAVRFLRDGLQGWNPFATLRGPGGVADLTELSIKTDDEHESGDTMHLVHAGGKLISRDLDGYEHPSLCEVHGVYEAARAGWPCGICETPAESAARA